MTSGDENLFVANLFLLPKTSKIIHVLKRKEAYHFVVPFSYLPCREYFLKLYSATTRFPKAKIACVLGK